LGTILLIRKESQINIEIHKPPNQGIQATAV
jgi:hypothetical protein